MGKIDELNRKLKDVNREIDLISSGRCPERSRLRDVSKLFTIVLFMILIAAGLFFTYSRISGFAVIGNESLNEMNVTNVMENVSAIMQNITMIPENISGNITANITGNITGNISENISENITGNIPENIAVNIPEKARISGPQLPEVRLRDRFRREQPYTTLLERESPASSKFKVRIDSALESVKNIDLEGVEENETLDITLEELPSEGTVWEQIYLIDFSNVNFTSGKVRSRAKGKSLYKCKTWNSTTERCEAVKVCTGGPNTKDSPACHYEGGWQRIMGITPGREYEFAVSPEDPVYAEYDSDFTAPYCPNGESPCIASTSLLACRDSVSDGNGPEPNQPNTIDSCSDGTSTYESPSCGGDESIENITVTDLNGTVFRPGDTINVTAWVYCWNTGADDNVNFIYTSDSETPSWSVKAYDDPCIAGGYHQTSKSWTLDDVEGNHTVRLSVQYNGATTSTCGTGGYDDNDDVVFLVSSNTPPSAPDSITCDSGICNSTFKDDVDIECSGSTDPDSDPITYVIDANYATAATTSDQESGTVQKSATPGAPSQSSVSLMFEGFEGTGWTTITGEDPSTGCAGGSGTNFNNCVDNGDYQFARTSGPTPMGGTYSWVADDWDTFAANAGIFYSFNPQTACSGYACSEVVISGYGAAGSVDNTNEYCKVWARNDTSTSYADIWHCTNGDACEFSGGNNAMPASSGDWTFFEENFTSIGLSLSGSTSASVHIGGRVPGGSDQCYFDSINITGVYTTFGTKQDENTTYTTYTDVDGSHTSISKVSVTVQVESYNPSASVQLSSAKPDLELDVYNGSAWVPIGMFGLQGVYAGSGLQIATFNFTLSTTDPSILTAWENVTNQDLRIKGVYLDYYDGSTIDEINYTGVWVDINTKGWAEIGNHSESGALIWNLSGLPEQTNVDLRCRAIDLTGSNTFSGYLAPSINLTITTADMTPPGSITGLSSPSKDTDWISWTWTNPADADFLNAIIYINGSNVLNTTNSFYNATGLLPYTDYTITVHTKDIYENINDTDVTDTQKTLAPTQPPTHTTPLLLSTYGTNNSDENLTCYNQSTYDINGDYVKNIYDWTVNDTSIFLTLAPFEGGSTGIWTREYSGALGYNLTASATWNATGGHDGLGAYEFDGSSQYIDLDSGGSSSVYDSAFTERTVALWYNADSVTGTTYRVLYGEGGGVNGMSLYIYDDGVWGGAWSEGSGWNGNWTSFSTTADEWHFVAVVFDGAGTSTSLYHDGSWSSISDPGATQVNAHSGDDAIGRADGTLQGPSGNIGSGSYFSGTIDEFMAFDRALSKEQLDALYYNMTNTLVSQETGMDDVWSCMVTPNDGTYDGTTLESNNLTVWYFVDNEPPGVIINSPAPGTHINRTTSLLINATVTDNALVENVLADISTPINGVETIELLPQGGNTYTSQFTDTTNIGRYNITIRANDTSGNLNDTESTWFNVTFYLPVMDDQLENISTNTTILQDYGGGIVDLEILPVNYAIHNVTIYGYNTSDVGNLYINNETIDLDFFRTYSIDLSELDFSTADVTVTSQGNFLYKCADFNFTSQNCSDDDNYTLLRADLIYGQNYTITLNSTDPGFGEVVEGPANISDAYFRSGRPDDNYGGLTRFRVGRRKAGNIIRGAIKFELPDLPLGAVITSAEVQLYFFRIPGTDTTAARTHGIYKVQQSPERNWTEMGVTWNNYTEAALWSSAGGDYNATPTDTQTLSSAEVGSFISYNVTGDVLNFYQNKSQNFGWIVRDTLEDINNARRDYRSKETGNAAQRPRLVINYTIPITINTVNDTPDPVNQSKNITIIANVTADLGVDSVWVEINDTNYSMVQQGAGIKRQFFDGFESGSITSNWTVVGNPGIYNRTQVTSSGCGQAAHSGTYFVLMDVNTNGNYETNVLKSTYDFTGATNIILDFYHFDSTDELQQIGDHAGDYVASCTGNNACGDGVFFSCDGNYWYRLEALGTESSWTYHNINISADPDFCPEINSSFAVKFMQHDNYACNFDGRGFDDINITWIVPDSPDNWVLVHNTSEENGLVNYTVYANDTLGRLAVPNRSNYTVIGPDLIPPATVTNLDEQYVGTHWVQWRWTNPSDPDFDHVEIWVNGTFYVNLSQPQNYYNVTGLVQNTVYEIQTRTADFYGNVNTTWVNDTARTIQANGSIVLDKFDYEQTEIVQISGFDWDAGENVSLDIEYNASSVSGYPKNITPDILGNFSHSYELLFNASLGLYNVSAVQLSNTSKNDLKQFNVSNFTGVPGYQPLRAGVELYVYLPPLHNLAGARPEDPFLFVTAFNDNTSLYIEDQNDDGDSDDSIGNDTNRIYLDEGQSILVYIANGTDTDIDDGDYFHVVADKQVAVWAGSNSAFMSYTVPSESGKLDGEEFYVYGRYDPDFHLPLDMVINSYYDDTNVRIYDVTGHAANADGTNASGYTNVTDANLGNLIDNQVIDEGEHMTLINNSLTPGGHTFYVAANKPVTIIAGSVREGSDYGGTENFGRDGGFYAVGKDGVTFSTLFYTYVTRGGASLGEDEMYFFSDQTSDVTVETFWENGTANETYNFQLNAGNDYFYELVGTNSSPYKKITSTEPIAVLCGAWLNQGTGDMGDFGTSLEGGGVGMNFNIYVPEPGGTGLSHAIIFAFYNSTYYEVYNSTNDALLANGTIGAGEHYDFTMMTDAHLIVNSTKNIAIEITNYDDNIGLYAVSSPTAFISVDKTSDIDEVALGDNVTYYVNIQNPAAVTINNLTIIDHIYNSVSYVLASEDPPLPGPIVRFNTPDPGITELEWNKSSLLPGEKVNITLLATPLSDEETLLLNRVNVNGTEEGGDRIEGADSTVVFLIDNSSPVIQSVIDFPDPQEINKIVRIEANITDNVFVSEAMVNINGTNYTMINGPGDIFYYDFNATSLGIYNYTVYASDAKGNEAVPVHGTFNIKPSADVEPFVRLVQPAPGYTEDSLLTNVTFECNATDNAGLVNISLYITDRYNQSFSLNSTSSLSGLEDSAQWDLELANGTYTWNCLAYDTDNNPAWSEFNRSVFIRVPDFTPPSVFDLVPPSVAAFNTSETIEIGANITDYNDIDTVLANISYPNGTTVQIILYQFGSTERYNSTFTIPNLEGVYTITFIANDTRSNVNATEKTSFEAATATHQVFGFITDSTNTTIPAEIYVYNKTGDLVWTDDEIYYFRLIEQRSYNITVMPTTGNLNEITYINVSVSDSILNFTRLEDSPEADTDKPDEISNWTEVVTWWTRQGFNFTTAKVNFSYGAGTDLVFWKCIDWNFDTRNCTNNNFTIVQSLPDGPASAVVYINASDPAGGAGKKPDYNESIKVWDVTSLNETGRRDNGTFVGEFYDLEDVNLTIGRSYRFEVFVTQINERAIGILRDPQYDNIQDDWIIDTTGLDAPNITQINGSVTIDTVTATIQAGSETGTQLMIWDSPPPHKTVDDMDANDTVKLWFVFDVPFNASSESHNGHFEGNSKGTDAEIINNLTTTLGSPPSKVNLTFPNNGNDTLVNRTLTFIWEVATDPDGHNLTYEINITSQFCADISDDNITATNYTPTVELGTFDECGAYNWTVRAYDRIYYGNWSDSWNFSIQPYVALIFLNDTVDFGLAENDQTNDTTDNNPIPLLIQSDGNVLTDVVNASMNQSFFIGTTYVDSDFQLKADNSAETGAFNWTGSAIDWINLTTIHTIIDYFDWHDNNDSAEIDVKIHVPIDEPTGVRITGLVFYGEQS